MCASREVFANTVGSKAERQTLIVIGGLPCEEAERRQILKEIEEIQRKIEGLQRLGDDPSVEATVTIGHDSLRISSVY